MLTLGVDLAGVLAQQIDLKLARSLRHIGHLGVPEIPEAFDSLRILNEHFNGNVFLVSQCRDRVEVKSREWLEARRFEARTGVSPQQFRFCRQRPEKAAIAEELGITHFIDNRLEIFSHWFTPGTLYLFQPDPRESQLYPDALPKVTVVYSWAEILQDATRV